MVQHAYHSPHSLAQHHNLPARHSHAQGSLSSGPMLLQQHQQPRRMHSSLQLWQANKEQGSPHHGGLGTTWQDPPDELGGGSAAASKRPSAVEPQMPHGQVESGYGDHPSSAEGNHGGRHTGTPDPHGIMPWAHPQQQQQHVGTRQGPQSVPLSGSPFQQQLQQQMHPQQHGHASAFTQQQQQQQLLLLSQLAWQQQQQLSMSGQLQGRPSGMR